jgi:hypothetical protein
VRRWNCHQNDRKVFRGSCAEVESIRREIRHGPEARNRDEIEATIEQSPCPSPFESRFGSVSLFLLRLGVQR